MIEEGVTPLVELLLPYLSTGTVTMLIGAAGVYAIMRKKSPKNSIATATHDSEMVRELQKVNESLEDLQRITRKGNEDLQRTTSDGFQALNTNLFLAMKGN